LINYVILIQLV